MDHGTDIFLRSRRRIMVAIPAIAIILAIMLIGSEASAASAPASYNRVGADVRIVQVNGRMTTGGPGLSAVVKARAANGSWYRRPAMLPFSAAGLAAYGRLCLSSPVACAGAVAGVAALAAAGYQVLSDGEVVPEAGGYYADGEVWDDCQESWVGGVSGVRGYYPCLTGRTASRADYWHYQPDAGLEQLMVSSGNTLATLETHYVTHHHADPTDPLWGIVYRYRIDSNVAQDPSLGATPLSDAELADILADADLPFFQWQPGQFPEMLFDPDALPQELQEPLQDQDPAEDLPEDSPWRDDEDMDELDHEYIDVSIDEGSSWLPRQCADISIPISSIGGSIGLDMTMGCHIAETYMRPALIAIGWFVSFIIVIGGIRS